MNLKQLQQSIKISMNILTKALKQLPTDKRVMMSAQVNQMMKKNPIDSNTTEQQLKNFKKQLDFNLNFMKLSNPKLDYASPTQNQMAQQGKQGGNNSSQSSINVKDLQENQPIAQKKQNKQNKNQEKQKDIHKFKLLNNQKIEIQRLNKPDVFDQQIEIQKHVRKEVQFTNWFDGNADPEQLRKHKQLLQRQHFQGQKWKGQQKPKNFAFQYLQSAILENQYNKQHGIQQQNATKTQIHDAKPEQMDQNNSVWDKVKR